MSSIGTLKRRIKSIQNIREITKAMEMIAAVRYKRLEARLKKSLKYSESLRELIGRLSTENLIQGNALFEDRPIRRELLIVLTGDRGLCGSFNNNILRWTQDYLRKHADHEVEVMPFGKVGLTFAKRRGWKIWESVTNLGYQIAPNQFYQRVENFVDIFLSKRFDRIQIVSMVLKRGGTHTVQMSPFLSLSFLSETEKKEELDYIFEPDRESTLKTLVDLFIKQNFFIILLKSVTAEYNARMVAMKLATDNAKDLIRDLTLERNKVRQAMITKEISEIIGGANALN